VLVSPQMLIVGLIVGISNTVHYCILEVEKLGISDSCNIASQVLPVGLFVITDLFLSFCYSKETCLRCSRATARLHWMLQQ